MDSRIQSGELNACEKNGKSLEISSNSYIFFATRETRECRLSCIPESLSEQEQMVKKVKLLTHIRSRGPATAYCRVKRRCS